MTYLLRTGAPQSDRADPGGHACARGPRSIAPGNPPIQGPAHGASRRDAQRRVGPAVEEQLQVDIWGRPPGCRPADALPQPDGKGARCATLIAMA
jgi:hypothetical protein